MKKSAWFKNKAKQRGRWNGTWTGNYSGKGLKGQKARSWHSMKAFFEWGQTSIIQRLPKAKGFKRPFKLVKVVTVINLWTLDQDKRISDTMEINKANLKALWYIKNESTVVKVLGDGDYSKHLTFTGIEHFSKSAQDKMTTPSKEKTGKVKVKSIKIQKVEKAAAKAARPARAPKVAKIAVAKPVKKVVKKVEWEVKKAAVKKPAAKKASE